MQNRESPDFRSAEVGRYDIYLAEFLKTYSKRTRIFAQELGDSQVSGHCGEKKHRGLAVLVGLIVKLSP